MRSINGDGAFLKNVADEEVLSTIHPVLSTIHHRDLFIRFLNSVEQLFRGLKVIGGHSCFIRASRSRTT